MPSNGPVGMNVMRNQCLMLAGLAGLFASAGMLSAAGADRIELDRNDQAGTLEVRIDGRRALVYQYGGSVDLPHYYPIFSPSGKELTIQQTEPYPHHRSVWFADKVQLAGQPTVEFYMALASRVDSDDPTSPFARRIRHVALLSSQSDARGAVIRDRLVWEADLGKTPYLD